MMLLVRMRKMKIDPEANEIVKNSGEKIQFYSNEGFEVIRDLWLKVGWNQKYTYTFSWLGVPIIQLPDDLLRYQEVVFALRPDVIIETGVAHGGSLIFSASLCRLMGRGRVIGVDIEIRRGNRLRLEQHSLSDLITLIEGSSTAAKTIAQVKSCLHGHETVLVVLDSNHSYEHVSKELASYAPLVSHGSYIVATDGIMRDLAASPRGRPAWSHDNPARAAEEFVARDPNFVIEEPSWPFNESSIVGNVTHWPSAWVKRISGATKSGEATSRIETI
jgi:cephalosporin hydroxylase